MGAVGIEMLGQALSRVSIRSMAKRITISLHFLLERESKSMKFFQDQQGRFHAGRCCGVLYIAGLILSCVGDIPSTLCAARAIFILGWWFAFGQKEQPRTLARMTHNPFRLVGLALLMSGLMAHFYISRQGFSIGIAAVSILIAVLAFAGGAIYRKSRP